MAEGAKDEENKPPKSLSFPALGRNAQLGDLYDAKTDTFIPGVNLFKTELKLDDHYKELTKSSVDIRYSQTDTLQQKLDLLDVKGEMRLTIGAAGHKIEGSAAYLNKQKESSREESLTLLTKAITKYQYIPDIKQLKKNVTDNGRSLSMLLVFTIKIRRNSYQLYLFYSYRHHQQFRSYPCCCGCYLGRINVCHFQTQQC